MLKQFFVRDRMVMTGLVVLGLLTVAAGFVSGRTTFQYALSTDARQASTVWVKRAERAIYAVRGGAGSKIDHHPVRIMEPGLLAEIRQQSPVYRAVETTIARTAHEQSGLLAGIDRLFSGWIRGLTDLLDSGSHVSQVVNFALLDPSGRPILRNAGFSEAKLQSLLSDAEFKAEFHKTLGMYKTRLIADLPLPGGEQDEFRKMVLVPVIDGDDISRVYALDIDQSSAATMSKVALVAASMMTSLLIVLGYSVPAAVAFRRIRERWKAEDQIRFLAMHDALTGLPNRRQMETRLEQAIMHAKRRGKRLAVMCLDLDRFKDVNDALGHQTGDAMLRETAERLRECVRESDMVARLGGDEFAIIAEDIDDPKDVIPFARRICQALSRSFEVNGHSLTNSGSVGITFAPDEGDEAETLMSNADLALYRAKYEGRNTFRFFEPEMDRAVQNRRRMSADLRHALYNDELSLHYQPQYDLRTGRLIGYEALARWHHPQKGEVPPDEFIPLAEEMGLIGTLGEWVLRTACSYARDWPGELTLAVNISPAQFLAQDIAATIQRVLEETGFPANRLLLEITENLLFRNTEETVETLKRLADLGVLLALDDFGTGYSCLSWLTRFPVSKIKIDRSFTEKLGTDHDISAIVGTIVGLGKSLNVTITAEGVETDGQAAYLRALGCNEVQGFLFGRPQPEILAGNSLHDQPVPLKPQPASPAMAEEEPLRQDAATAPTRVRDTG